jgi:hypothetical protein
MSDKLQFVARVQQAEGTSEQLGEGAQADGAQAARLQ